MGMGQHGDVLPLLGHAVQGVEHLIELGQVDVLDTLHQAEGHRGVVDVLGGEAEVDELLVAGRDAHCVETPLYEVFHRLDVMVGGLLYLLDLGGLVLGHVAVDAAQSVEEAAVEVPQLGQRQLAQGDEVLYLHADSVSYEGKFGIVGGKVPDLSVVPPVDG